jgi:hypothetical protein
MFHERALSMIPYCRTNELKPQTLKMKSLMLLHQLLGSWQIIAGLLKAYPGSYDQLQNFGLFFKVDPPTAPNLVH